MLLAAGMQHLTVQARREEPARSAAAGLGACPGGRLVPSAGEQERGDRVGETVWVLPEQQMAQFGEDNELGAGDAVREQLAVGRVHQSVRIEIGRASCRERVEI